ncbi:hypothetical protein AB4Z48_25440 [Cupriavidus sp. 2TAF22]|uniref:hypothetical protein n=1 Tax=unclassified Cupriavidus TaxID=2640874 RepID=UPI003F8F365D
MDCELRTADDAGAGGLAWLGIYANRIVDASDYRLISQAVSLVTETMYLEVLPLASDGCLFRWRFEAEYRTAYMEAFRAVFAFVGIPLAIR